MPMWLLSHVKYDGGILRMTYGSPGVINMHRICPLPVWCSACLRIGSLVGQTKHTKLACRTGQLGSGGGAVEGMRVGVCIEY